MAANDKGSCACINRNTSNVHNSRGRPLIGEEIPCKSVACKEDNCPYQSNDFNPTLLPPKSTVQSHISIDLKCCPSSENQKKRNVIKARRPRKKRLSEYDIPGGSGHCESIVLVLPPTGYQIRHHLCEYVISKRRESIASLLSLTEDQLKHQLSRRETKPEQEKKLEPKSDAALENEIQKQNLKSVPEHNFETKNKNGLETVHRPNSDVQTSISDFSLSYTEPKPDTVLQNEPKKQDLKSRPEFDSKTKNKIGLETVHRPNSDVQTSISNFSLSDAEPKPDTVLQNEPKKQDLKSRSEFDSKTKNKSGLETVHRPNSDVQTSISDFSLSYTEPKPDTVLENEPKNQDLKSRPEYYFKTKNKIGLETVHKPNFDIQTSISNLSLSEPEPKPDTVLENENQKQGLKYKREIYSQTKNKNESETTSNYSLSERESKPEQEKKSEPMAYTLQESENQKLNSKSRPENYSKTKNKSESESDHRPLFNQQKSDVSFSLSEPELILDLKPKQKFSSEKKNQKTNSKPILKFEPKQKPKRTIDLKKKDQINSKSKPVHNATTKNKRELVCDHRPRLIVESSSSSLSLTESKSKTRPIEHFAQESEIQKLNSKSRPKHYSETKNKSESESDHRPLFNLENSNVSFSSSEPELILEPKPKRNFPSEKENQKIRSNSRSESKPKQEKKSGSKSISEHIFKKKNKHESEFVYKPKFNLQNSVSNMSLLKPETKQERKRKSKLKPDTTLENRSTKLDLKSKQEFYSKTKKKSESESDHEPHFNLHKSVSKLSLLESKPKQERRRKSEPKPDTTLENKSPKMDLKSKQEFYSKMKNRSESEPEIKLEPKSESKPIGPTSNELELDRRPHSDLQYSTASLPLLNKGSTEILRDSVRDAMNKQRISFFKRKFSKKNRK